MILSTLLLLLLGTASAKPTCRETADHRTINKAFSDGGPGTKVYLCPGKTYSLSGMIVFTGADQELATLGYPTDNSRARLTIDSEVLVTAVQGDCRRCARVSIASIVIDGGRARLGRSQDAAAPGMVVLGGNEGQRVVDSVLTHPRGWAALHIREGAKLQCKGAVVERNVIGPAGEEYNPSIDGPDPEMSPLGRPLADGLAIACRDSVVRDNTFVDCTDAGMVIYGSPGSMVANNRISTVGSSAMGGILMVDALPFDGDYSGLVVTKNVLDATARPMRVGIGIGLSILSDDIETILHSGTVTRNRLQGPYMGFGIAAAGLKDWVVKDNWSEARHQGKRSARCFDEPVNPDPMAFLYHKATIEGGEMQPDFVDHDFAYIVCIDGLEEHEMPADTPAPAPEEEEEETQEQTGTGNEALDGILSHSQQSMLDAIAKLGQRVDAAIAAKDRGDDMAEGKRSSAPVDFDSESLAELEARLDAIEREQAALVASAKGLHSQVNSLNQQVIETHIWQLDVLLHIKQEFYEGLRSGPSVVERERVNNEEVHGRATESAGMSDLPTPVFILAAAAVLGVAYRAVTVTSRRRKRLSHSKVV